MIPVNCKPHQSPEHSNEQSIADNRNRTKTITENFLGTHWDKILPINSKFTISRESVGFLTIFISIPELDL